MVCLINRIGYLSISLFCFSSSSSSWCFSIFFSFIFSHNIFSLNFRLQHLHFRQYIFICFSIAFFFFSLFLFRLAGTCLKDLKIYVPEAVATGDAVTLSCYYNLENVSILLYCGVSYWLSFFSLFFEPILLFCCCCCCYCIYFHFFRSFYILLLFCFYTSFALSYMRYMFYNTDCIEMFTATKMNLLKQVRYLFLKLEIIVVVSL